MATIAAASLQAAPPLLAHDLWITPSSFAPGLGEPVRLQLVLGSDGAVVDTLPRSDSAIVRFDLVGPHGADQPVRGMDGLDPAGFLRPLEPGWYTVVYESRPALTSLQPELFRAYLLEKGLAGDASRAASPGAGPLPAPQEPTTELFRRSIKARIQVVAPDREPVLDPGESGSAGLPLELVLERVWAWAGGEPEPAGAEWGAAAGAPGVESRAGAAATPGDAARLTGSVRRFAVMLRLLDDGAPLAAAQVDLRPLDDLGAVASGSTGADGRLEVALGPGRWLATAVRLDRSRPATAEWESVWASLTFELGAASASAAPSVASSPRGAARPSEVSEVRLTGEGPRP